jgi:hypothetical protein
MMELQTDIARQRQELNARPPPPPQSTEHPQAEHVANTGTSLRECCDSLAPAAFLPCRECNA